MDLSKRALAAESKASKERDEAQLQRQRADERFRLAFQAVHKLRYVYPNLRSVAGPERTLKMRRTVQEDLLRFYRQMVENNEDDPRFTYEVAESCFFLGGPLRRHGRGAVRPGIPQGPNSL